MEVCCVAWSVRLFATPMDCSPPGSSGPWDFPSKNTGGGCHFLLQDLRTALLLHCRRIHCQWATREAPVPSDPRGNQSTPGSPKSRPPPPGRSRTDWSSVAKATSDPSRGGLAPQPQSRDSALPWGLPAPHPGDAFLAAQGPQHLGHVAHHARVLHTHHAPLAAQLHWDGGARPSVSRRHPCQSSQAHRGGGGMEGERPLLTLLEVSSQWFREGIVPGSPPCSLVVYILEFREARRLRGGHH